MIDFHSSQGESQEAWEGFLNDLYKRGIKGKSCELIITDGGKGLHSALEYVYPKILRQRCWAHKTRNILDKVRKKDWDVVKKTLQNGHICPSLCKEQERSNKGILGICRQMARHLSECSQMFGNRYRGFADLFPCQRRQAVVKDQDDQCH